MAAKEIAFDTDTDAFIDPLKVTRGVLANAVSVAVTILTTEALITDAQENDAR